MSTVHNLPVSHRQWAQVFTITLSSDETDYDLNAAVQALGWNGTDVVAVQLTINGGVQVKASATSSDALTISDFPTGSFIKVINNGEIVGRGGAGGGGSCGGPGGAGGQGGDALVVSGSEVHVDNQGEINGGGGGGGGGGAGETRQWGTLKVPCSAASCRGCGGNGGAGYGPTTQGGGASGSGCVGDGCTDSVGGSGASGGGKGAAGGTGGHGGAPDGFAGGSGGAAGNAVVGNSNITWINTGTRNGGIS